MKPVYILAAVLIFGVLIAVHEFGHFIAAKLSGVRVNEFSIGMGPRLWHRQGKETEYSLRLLPVGGFCAMEGEDEDTGDERAFVRQGFWKQFVILVAGSAMNFLAGLLILVLLFSGAQVIFKDQISGFAPGFPLEGEDGLMAGDVFYRIDGYRTYLYGDASLFLNYHTGDTIDLEVIRNGEHIKLQDFPMARAEYQDQSGNMYEGFGLYLGAAQEPATAGSKLRYAWYSALDNVQMVTFSLSQLVAGNAGLADFSGPVGIVSAMTEAGETAATQQDAWLRIFSFAAMLAVNLAVMNLLPLPALDGGRIFLLLLDTAFLALFGKKIPEKYHMVVNAAGFVIIMGFMLLITFQDVFRLFG